MKTFDHGFDNEKGKGKIKRKKENSNRAKVFRYVASLNQEQISRMMENSSNQFAQPHVDATGRAIMRNSMNPKNMTVQAKLEISQPGDSSEMQADKVADAVSRGDVNMSRMTMQQTGSEINAKGEGGTLTTTPEFNQQLESSKGSGSKMDEGTKSEMEHHMGTDLSGVNIHTGSTASNMSENINAKAFTHGQDVYFKDGNYNPKSGEGKNLLAHELTHTVQQNSGKVQPKIQRQKNPKTPVEAIVYELELGEPDYIQGAAKVSYSMKMSVNLNQDYFENDKNGGFKEKVQDPNFKATFKQKAGGKANEVMNKISGSVAEKGGEYKFGNGFSIEVDAGALEGTMSSDKDKIDFNALYVKIKGKGQINAANLMSSPFGEIILNDPDLADNINKGLGVDVSFEIKVGINPADIKKLIEKKKLLREQEEMVKKMEKLKPEIDELTKLKNARREKLLEEFKQSNKLGKKTYQNFSKKEKAAFDKLLKRDKEYSKLAEKLGENKKVIKKLTKGLEETAERLLKVSKVKGAVGRILEKQIFKTSAKFLARAIPIVDIVLLAYDLAVIARFSDKMSQEGEGETPWLWDDVPKTDPKDADQSGGDKKDKTTGGTGDSKTPVTTTSTDSTTTAPGDTTTTTTDVKAPMGDEKGTTTTSDSTKTTSSDTTATNTQANAPTGILKPEEVEAKFKTATDVQKNIFDALKNENGSVVATGDFIDKYLVLDFKGIKVGDDNYKRVMDELAKGKTEGASEEEVLTRLQKILDGIKSTSTDPNNTANPIPPVTTHKDQNTTPTDVPPSTTPVETEISGEGKVLDYQEPSGKSTPLNLRWHGAIGLPSKPVIGKVYTFKLVIHYTDGNKIKRVARSTNAETFKFVRDSQEDPGAYLFTVVTPFRIETTLSVIYYSEGYTVKIRP
jgi:hypothetical protein